MDEKLGFMYMPEEMELLPLCTYEIFDYFVYEVCEAQRVHAGRNCTMCCQVEIAVKHTGSIYCSNMHMTVSCGCECFLHFRSTLTC